MSKFLSSDSGTSALLSKRSCGSLNESSNSTLSSSSSSFSSSEPAGIETPVQMSDPFSSDSSSSISSSSLLSHQTISSFEDIIHAMKILDAGCKAADAELRRMRDSTDEEFSLFPNSRSFLLQQSHSSTSSLDALFKPSSSSSSSVSSISNTALGGENSD